MMELRAEALGLKGDQNCGLHPRDADGMAGGQCRLPLFGGGSCWGGRIRVGLDRRHLGADGTADGRCRFPLDEGRNCWGDPIQIDQTPAGPILPRRKCVVHRDDLPVVLLAGQIPVSM